MKASPPSFFGRGALRVHLLRQGHRWGKGLFTGDRSTGSGDADIGSTWLRVRDARPVHKHFRSGFGQLHGVQRLIPNIVLDVVAHNEVSCAAFPKYRLIGAAHVALRPIVIQAAWTGRDVSRRVATRLTSRLGLEIRFRIPERNFPDPHSIHSPLLKREPSRPHQCSVAFMPSR